MLKTQLRRLMDALQLDVESASVLMGLSPRTVGGIANGHHKNTPAENLYPLIDLARQRGVYVDLDYFLRSDAELEEYRAEKLRDLNVAADEVSIARLDHFVRTVCRGFSDALDHADPVTREALIDSVYAIGRIDLERITDPKLQGVLLSALREIDATRSIPPPEQTPANPPSTESLERYYQRMVADPPGPGYKATAT